MKIFFLFFLNKYKKINAYQYRYSISYKNVDVNKLSYATVSIGEAAIFVQSIESPLLLQLLIIINII